MAAKVLELADDTLPDGALAEVLAALARGRLVALPTETGYGVFATDHDAGRAGLERLGGRPLDESRAPYAVAAAEELAQLDVQWVPPARRLAEAFWPGPLTLILPSRTDEGWRGHRSLGVPVARTIAQRAGRALRFVDARDAFGDPPPDAAALAARAGDALALIVARETKSPATPTVVRLGRGPLQIVREGSITAADVRRTAGRRVLFVCTGNTCRSPMAAALLERTLCERLRCDPRELADMGYRIASAGVSAAPGAPASEGSGAALAELGLSLAAHRSQPVTAELLAAMDHVFALGSRHRNLLLELWPTGTAQVALLRADGGDIADPFGGPLEVYRKARDEIAAEIRRLARWL